VSTATHRRGVLWLLVVLLGAAWGLRPSPAWSAGDEVGRVIGWRQPAGGPNDAEDSEPVRRFVYLDEDFELNDQVHKARFFEMQDNWTKAFQIYHEVLLKAKATTLVRLDDRTFGNLRVHVRRRLAAMPPERLHQYRLLYDGAAERLLEEALWRKAPDSFHVGGLPPFSPLSLDKLEQVATLYFATSVGDDALDILGDVYRERGEWQRAAARWRQVLEVYPDTDLSRPHLWAKVATGYAAVGDRARASAALKQLRKSAGEAGLVRIGGTPTPLASTLEGEIARLGDRPAATVVDGSTWPQVGGTAQHVAIGPTAGPANVRTWRFRLPEAAKPASPRRPYSVPTLATPGALMCPVSAGGRLFAHDRRTVYAIDGATGRLAWSFKGTLTPPATSGRRRVVYPGSGTATPQTACAVDAGRVYAVLGDGASGQRKVVALDQENGRLIWSKAVPVGASNQPATVVGTSEVVVAGGTVFLRAACASSGASTNVYYSGTHFDHHVVAFDAKTGAVRWHQFVCTASSMSSPYLFSGTYLVATQLSVPAADEQRVYISTNGGAVAALDVRSGEVVWATLYEKSTVDRKARARLLAFRVRRDPRGTPEAPWRSSAPLVLGSRVFFTPSDADALFCLDAETGRLLWQRPRKKGQFVVGAHSGRLFVVGAAVEAVDAVTGGTIWRRAQPALKPSGHPFLTESALFVPTDKRLYRYDTGTGTVVATFRFDPRDPASETGNLVWTGETLVTASATAINGLGDRTKVMADLAARIKANPSDAEAYFQLGEIHSRSEEYEPAIRQYEKGLAVCPPDIRYQSSSLRDVFRSRLYEHHHDATAVAARTGQHEGALAHAKACLGYATNTTLRLKAKLLLVSGHGRLKQWRDVADVWQSVLLQEPREEYAQKDGSSTTAGAHARRQLADLIKAHGRAIYATHDAAARRLLAAGDRRSLERVLAGYPNSLARPPATLALGDLLYKSGDFRHAVTYYRRHLRGPASTDRAQTYAKMIDSQLKSGWKGSARRSLKRLLAECPADKVRMDGREMDVRTYVAVMRARPAIASVPMDSEIVLPDLALPLERAWTKPFPGARFLSLPPDAADTRSVCFSSGSTLVCLDAATGRQRWLRAVPGMPRVYRTVTDGRSILAADNARVACISLKTGQVEWVRSLPEPKGAADANRNINVAGRVVIQGGAAVVLQLQPGRVQANLAGLALSDQGALVTRRRWQFTPGQPRRTVTKNEVTLLDRDTGRVLWRQTCTGYPAQTPLLLDDTALVCVQNPNRVLALEIDDGSTRYEWKFGNTSRLHGPPVALSPEIACFVVGTGRANDVMAVDLHDGTVAWKRRITAQGRFTHSPVTLARRGKRVLYLSRRGACAALDANDGKVLWRTSYPGGTVYQNHVLAGDEAIFAVGQAVAGKNTVVRLTRIDIATGGVTWSIQLPEPGLPRDVRLSTEHVVVAMTPQRTTTRRVGNREIRQRIGLPPQVFVVNQHDGEVEAVLKVSKEGANARLTHQPTWLALSDGRAVVSHLSGLVGFGPAQKKD